MQAVPTDRATRLRDWGRLGLELFWRVLLPLLALGLGLLLYRAWFYGAEPRPEEIRLENAAWSHDDRLRLSLADGTTRTVQPVSRAGQPIDLQAWDVDPTRAVYWSPDDPSLRVLDLDGGSRWVAVQPPPKSLCDVLLVPDGVLMMGQIAGQERCHVDLVDPATGALRGLPELQSVEARLDDGFAAMVDDTQLVACDPHGKVRRVLHRLGDEERIESVSPDGRLVVVADEDFDEVFYVDGQRIRPPQRRHRRLGLFIDTYAVDANTAYLEIADFILDTPARLWRWDLTSGRMTLSATGERYLSNVRLPLTDAQVQMLERFAEPTR